MGKDIKNNSGHKTGSVDDIGRTFDHNYQPTGRIDSINRWLDNNGNVQGRVDGSGNIYDPYGNRIGHTGGSSSSSTCYIATATLNHRDHQSLDLLRAFRDTFIFHMPMGQHLIAYYRKTGPIVAEFIQERPLLKASFRYPFISPSLVLLQRKDNNLLHKILVFILFLSGLAWASVLYMMVRVRTMLFKSP